MCHLIDGVISFTISLQISNEIKNRKSAPPNINSPTPSLNSVEASETLRREKLVEKVWTPLMSKTRVRAKAVTMTAKMIIRSVISIAKKKGRIRKATGLANTARIAIQIIVVLLRKLVVSSITFSSSRRLMTSWASSLGVPSSAITRDSFSGPASSKYYLKYSRASSWSFGGNFRRYFVNLAIYSVFVMS